MRRCFFDTSAYVALTDASDQFHPPAVETARSIAAAHVPRATTNYVLAESYTRIRRKLGHDAVVRFGEGIRRDIQAGNLHVEYADEELDWAAWDLLREHADQRFSFVDCVSFVWLRRQSGVEVVAFDQHFLGMGFAPYQP